jgi:uncharacterized protein GlcG (DUF336 family)
VTQRARIPDKETLVKHRKSLIAAAFVAGCTAAPLTAFAQDATYAVKLMTLEAATTAARAALEHCRKAGYQVGVAVVDRTGLPQVFLRDRFAGAHTFQFAIDKAWTAASFRITTADLARETEPNRPMSGMRTQPRVAAFGGGLPIQAGGATLGAIGVSGAPGGDADEACAAAGIKAIADSLEF